MQFLLVLNILLLELIVILLHLVEFDNLILLRDVCGEVVCMLFFGDNVSLGHFLGDGVVDFDGTRLLDNFCL